MDENNIITIDIGEREVNLFVGGLNRAQGNIKIVGTGKLNIYAKNITSIKDSMNTNENSSLLNMYGSKVIILDGVPSNGQIIVAPNANVLVREGGNIKGIVIANSLLADGDTSITYGSPVVPISKPILTTPKTEKVIGGIDLLSEIFIEVENPLMEIDIKDLK